MTANHHILLLINIFDLEMESDLKSKKNNEWNHWNIRRLEISTCVLSTKAGLLSTAKIVFVLLLTKQQTRNILHRIWVQINHIFWYVFKNLSQQIKYSKVVATEDHISANRAITSIMKSIALRWTHYNGCTMQSNMHRFVAQYENFFKTIAHVVWRFLVSIHVYVCLYRFIHACWMISWYNLLA